MPTTRSVTRYLLIAVALAALAVLVWRISEVVIAAFGGIVGAAVLRVLSRPLVKHTRLGERWSVVVAVVVVLAALGLVGWLFGSQVADQAAEMRRVLPDATRRVVDTFQQSALGRAVLSSTKQAAQQSNPMSGVSVAAGAVFRAVGDLLLVFFLSLYFALDPGEYLRGLLRLFPPSRRGQIESALREAGEALEKWVFAQLIAMAVVGGAVGISLGLLGVPLALLLGTMAAILEFIPVVGPIIFTVPGVLVAVTQGSHVVFYVLLVYVAIQQVESNILTPLLQRWAVRLPPVIALLSVLAGGLLFGVMGVVFATPAAVVVTALVKHLYVEDTLERSRSAKDAGAPANPAGPGAARAGRRV